MVKFPPVSFKSMQKKRKIALLLPSFPHLEDCSGVCSAGACGAWPDQIPARPGVRSRGVNGKSGEGHEHVVALGSLWEDVTKAR